jgi:hypothetical protein
MLFDVAARKPLAHGPLPVKEGYVTSVAFGPGGRALAAGYRTFDGGGGVVLFEAAARERLTEDPLAMKEHGVHSVAFGPDGKALAAGYNIAVGSDSKARDGGGVDLWDMDLGSWQRLAGRIANRNLTRDEWQHFFPVGPSYRPTFPDLPIPPEVPAQEGGKSR